MGIAGIWRDFCGWTTAHGVPHIGSSLHWSLKLFWTVVVLLGLGLFSWQFYNIISNYLLYPVNIGITIQFKEIYFPEVAIANINPYRLKPLTSADTRFIQLFNDTSNAMLQLPTNPAFGYTGVTDQLAILTQSKFNQQYLASTMDQKLRQNATISITDFIIQCTYNQVACDLGKNMDFITSFDNVYGMRFAFNAKTPPTYTSTRAGPLYGLRLLLRVDQSQYLPTSESAGVRVYVGDQAIQPSVSTYGRNAAVGYATSIAVSFTTTELLSKPYGPCINSKDSVPYFYMSGSYYVEGCTRSCFQAMVMSKCGCYDPRYTAPSGNSLPNCATFMLPTPQRPFTCMFNLTQIFNPVTQCTCPPPCKETTYSVTISMALWPADAYEPDECKDKSIWNQTNSTSICKQWYHDNTALVEVYYATMNFQDLQASPAITVLNLITSVGGNTGLFMGFSLITIVEFLCLLVLMLIYCCRRNDLKRKANERHKAEEAEKRARRDERKARQLAEQQGKK